MRETVLRLIARFRPNMDPQLVLNHLVQRPFTGCLDMKVQEQVEGHQQWVRNIEVRFND